MEYPHYRTALLTGATLCISATPAIGDETQWRFEVTPQIGFVAGGKLTDEFTNQELELRDSNVTGIQVNVRADPRTTWEIDYARQKTHTATPGMPSIDVIIEKVEVGGTYEINTESMRPYAAATIGISRFKPESATFRDDSYFSYSLGGGVKFFADRQVGIVIDARWVAAVVNEDTDIFCLSADGLVCLIETDAGLLSQFRLFAGVSVRF